MFKFYYNMYKKEIVIANAARIRFSVIIIYTSVLKENGKYCTLQYN